MSSRRKTRASPEVLCKKGIDAYNTIILDKHHTIRIYNYTEAIKFFEEAVNIFEAVVPINNYKYGEALYYLYECYRYKPVFNADLAEKLANKKRAKKYLIRSLEKEYPLAYCEIAFDMESIIKRRNIFGKDEGTYINELYTEGINQLVAVSKTEDPKRYAYMRYQFLQLLIIILELCKDLQEDIREEGATNILKLLTEQINNYGPAMCQYADILTASDEGSKPIYQFIHSVYKTKSIRSLRQSPIYFYNKAAEEGELRAALKISEHYMNLGDYKEMMWWHWWSVLYKKEETEVNRAVISAKIRKIIQKDQTLKQTYRAMSTVYIEDQQKRTKDYRTRMDIQKQLFLEMLKARKRTQSATCNP